MLTPGEPRAQTSRQRACRRDWLLSVPHLREERWPEPAITAHLERTGLRWAYVELPEVGQVLKEKKRGFIRGVVHRTRMYADLLTYGVRRGRSGEDDSEQGGGEAGRETAATSERPLSTDEQAAAEPEQSPPGSGAEGQGPEPS